MRVFLVSVDDIPVQIPDELVSDSQMIKDLLQDFNPDGNEDLNLKTSFTLDQLNDQFIVSDYLLCSDDTILKLGIPVISKSIPGHIAIIRNYPALLAIAQFHKLIDEDQDDTNLIDLINTLTMLLNHDVSDQPYKISLIRHINSTLVKSNSMRIIMNQVTESILHLVGFGYPSEVLAFLLGSRTLPELLMLPLTDSERYQLITVTAEFNLNSIGYSKWFAKEIITILLSNSQYLDSIIDQHLELTAAGLGDDLNSDILLQLLDNALKMRSYSIGTILKVINSHKKMIHLPAVLDMLITHNYIEDLDQLELDGVGWSIVSSERLMDISNGESRVEFINRLFKDYCTDTPAPPNLGRYIRDILNVSIIQDNQRTAISLINHINFLILTIKGTGRALAESKTVERLSQVESSDDSVANIKAIGGEYQDGYTLVIHVDVTDGDMYSIRTKGESFLEWVTERKLDWDRNQWVPRNIIS